MAIVKLRAAAGRIASWGPLSDAYAKCYEISRVEHFDSGRPEADAKSTNRRTPGSIGPQHPGVSTLELQFDSEPLGL
jgi:hypothetical protein